MSDIANRIAGLSVEKRRLLLAQLSKKKGKHSPIHVQRRDTNIFPLSFAQQRLWIVDQLMPGSTAYLIPGALRVQGILHCRALEQSIRLLVERHESLRTTFEERGGQAVQVIHPADEAAALSLRMIDLEGLSSQEREEEVTSLAHQESHRPFDLARGPLLRTSLLRLTPEEHVLLLAVHHIITDGWSNGILQRELRLLYQACAAGEPSPLEAPPIQYVDYALWQREWLQGEVLQEQLDYWKKQLAGLTPLELPTDHPRPAVQSGQGASRSLLVPDELHQQLKALSQREGVTPFVTQLTAFQVLLMRYSGQHDIVIGSPITNRTRRELEGLVGFVTNTLVLRGDLSGNPSFQQLLRRVQEMMLQAYANQDMPFEKLVAELEPERDLSRQPLFQVQLVPQQFPLQAFELPDAVWSPFDLAQPGSKFDLLMGLTEVEEGLLTTIEYRTDLFEATTIERLLMHWLVLLEAITRDPTQPVGQLPLLTDGERALLREWNTTGRDYLHDCCLHQLFEQQVERSPDAVALVFEGEHLTYRMLNSRANQLAHALQAIGVKPEIMVGVCLERSLEMVIALLGVLKAGGAYVPFDPAYPQERLASMIFDSQVVVLLTQKSLVEQLPQKEVALICLDSCWQNERSEPGENPCSTVEPDNLVYMIYTSGSTGKPKGVMNAHRGVCNRLHWMQQAYQLSGNDRVLQKTPFSFDVSVWEFFWPLIVGARLVVACPGGHQDPCYLASLIDEQQVTTLHFVPSMLDAFLLESDLETRCGSLRHVMCSGEALTFDVQERFFQRFTRASLHNLYGPTEAAIDVTYWQCRRGSQVPIGSPIANIQLHVLDEAMQPIPIGVPGELYIGGVGVARGYLNRPELTAERFVPDALSGRAGARLYHTGDRGRYRADGAIEFLGRRDRQVKIRGFRIELGEIEACIRAYPLVRACVVAAHDRAGLGKRLVAYLVADQPCKIDLQQFLQGRLPDYMIPTAFVFVDAFPLTENGKLDYRRLEALAEESGQSEGFLPPRTAVEKALASIWSEVLGVPQVGIRDSFFALGGDSIVSIQIVSRARQMGFQLTPRHLFLYRTIEQLSQEIEQAQPHLAEQRVEPGLLPLTPIQHWFFSREIPTPQHWNQAFRLEVAETLHWESLERALSTVLEHHDALRLRFSQRSDGSWEQWYSEGEAEAPLCWVDLSALPQVEQTAALGSIEADTQKSLNLLTGPILRVVFCQCDGGAPDYLLCAIHHLAVDGVSWRILFEDVQLAYAQHTKQLPLHLPPKTSSYRAWAEHLALYAHSPVLRAELPHWLAPAYRQAPEIPVDLFQGWEENKEYTARKVFVSLSAAATQTLLEVPLRLYQARMQEVIITALMQTLTGWIGGSTLLMDMEGHGREDIFPDVDVSRTVGWFTSIFPVCLQLEPGSSIEEAMTTIKAQVLNIPVHGLGYGVLSYLNEEKAVHEALRMQPRAGVLFNYLGQLDQLFSPSQMFAAAQPCYEATKDPQGRRSHLFDITCWMANKQLHICWSYSKNLHHASTVEQLTRDFLGTLERYVEHCEAAFSKRGYRAEEFSDIDLSQTQLERILALVEEEA